MDRLFLLNRPPWYWRLPIKVGLFALVLLAVSYPHPARLARHVERWRNPNRLIEPQSPALQPWLQELRPRITSDMQPPQVLKTVESFVNNEKVPYEWDWVNWGNADHIPTVAEVLQAGKEDCDGRAVVAASLLAALGYRAELVTDFSHVWVRTDQGETMGPGKAKAVIATDKGVQLQPGALAQLLRGVPYGISVFPLTRELLVLVTLWYLLLRRGGGWLCNGVALLLLVNALLFVRLSGRDYTEPVYWAAWVGVANGAVAIALLLTWARRNSVRAASAGAGQV